MQAHRPLRSCARRSQHCARVKKKKKDSKKRFARNRNCAFVSTKTDAVMPSQTHLQRSDYRSGRREGSKANFHLAQGREKGPHSVQRGSGIIFLLGWLMFFSGFGSRKRVKNERQPYVYVPIERAPRSSERRFYLGLLNKQLAAEAAPIPPRTSRHVYGIKLLV